MNRVLVLSIGGILVAGSVTAASAQSLADVARQEQERRKAIKQPTRVYTDADVKRAAPLTTAAARPQAPAVVAPGDDAAAAAGGAAEGAAKPAASKPAGALEDESAWQTKVQEARDGLARSRRLLGALEQQAMRAAIVAARAASAGQPAPGDTGDQERSREIERLRADVGRFQTVLSSIEEDARRAGVPAGWVR